MSPSKLLESPLPSLPEWCSSEGAICSSMQLLDTRATQAAERCVRWRPGSTCCSEAQAAACRSAPVALSCAAELLALIRAAKEKAAQARAVQAPVQPQAAAEPLSVESDKPRGFTPRALKPIGSRAQGALSLKAAGSSASPAVSAAAGAGSLLQQAAAASSAEDPPAQAQGIADGPQSRDRPLVGISLKAKGMLGTARGPAGASAQAFAGPSAATPAVTGLGRQGLAQPCLDPAGGSSEAAARLRAQLALPFVAAPEQTPEVAASAPAGALQGQPSKALSVLQVSFDLVVPSGTLNLFKAS